MALWVAYPAVYFRGSRKYVTYDSTEFFANLTAAELIRWRGRASELYQKLYPTHTEHTPLGFVPSHISATVAEETGIKFKSDFDSKMFQMAVMLPVKVSEGTWESGPGKWSKPMASPVPRMMGGE